MTRESKYDTLALKFKKKKMRKIEIDIRSLKQIEREWIEYRNFYF